MMLEVMHMRKFVERYAAWFLLAICFLITVAILAWPQREGEEPAQPAVAARRTNRFVGEELYAQPYLPDEPVWNASLGLWQTHCGIDVQCENVLSAIEGEIVRAWKDRLWDMCVEIQAEGETLIYRSLSSICVRAGDWLQKGELIGQAGAAACEAHLGAHAHLEYTVQGGAADPTALLDTGASSFF